MPTWAEVSSVAAFLANVATVFGVVFISQKLSAIAKSTASSAATANPVTNVNIGRELLRSGPADERKGTGQSAAE